MDYQKIFFDDEGAVGRIWYKNEWWFLIEDVIETLIGESNIWDYLKEMRKIDQEFDIWYSRCVIPLGNCSITKQSFYCVNLEGVFRLVQSINHPKTEPFKLWLAKLGKMRIDELNNGRNSD